MKFDKIANNSAWEIAQNLYMSAVSLIIGLVAARYLGPDNYGLIAIVTSIISMVTSVAWLGIDSIVVNEFVVNKQNEEIIIGVSIALRTIVSVVSLPLLNIIIKQVYHNSIMQKLLWILGFAMILQFYEIFYWWYQSSLKIKEYSLVMIITTTIAALYQLFLIISKKNVYWFASVNLLKSALILIGLVSIYFVKYGKKIRLSLVILKNILGKSYHFIISALAITLYMQIDKLMIGKMISTKDAGYYTVAVSIGELWRFIPIAVINSARPVLFEYKSKKPEEFEKYLKMLIFTISFFTFCVCLLINVFATPIVYILYGKQYLPAVASLRVTSWAMFFSVIGVIRGIWIVANNYNKYDKYFTISAAILNIILNYIFINFFGILGAALSTLITYAFETIIINIFFKNTRKFNEIIFQSFRERNKTFRYVCKKIRNK